MKAVSHTRDGNAEVRQLTTLGRPVPRQNDAPIRVQAAGAIDPLRGRRPRVTQKKWSLRDHS